MIRVLQWASKKTDITIQDESDNAIDPTTLVRVKIFVYSQKFKLLAKFFYSNTEPTPTGYTTATLIESSVADSKIRFILNSSVTGEAAPGNYTIQIQWVETDTDFEDNEEVHSNKGDYLIIEKAMN